MIACVDVGYSGQQALAACVVIANWTDSQPAQSHTLELDSVEEYVPGQFYKRELPCLLDVLRKVTAPASCIVIDGYVWLGPGHKQGLGARLYDALDRRIPVIGVAKTFYAQDIDAVEILRGTSNRPLWITAVGIDVDTASKLVQSMHGIHRLPTILKHVDRLSKGNKELSVDP